MSKVVKEKKPKVHIDMETVDILKGSLVRKVNMIIEEYYKNWGRTEINDIVYDETNKEKENNK